jgi:hypothetical protein
MRQLKNIAIALLAILAIWGWGRYTEIRLRAALAEEQTQFFEEVVEQALQRTNSQDIAADIEAIRIYYPAGSKQRTGSHLDLIVERARKEAIRRLQEATVNLESLKK